MSERSLLRVRARGHFNPERADEVIVEAVRDGEVVATIYGSREGVHIVSERLATNSPPFLMAVAGAAGSYVVPLLAAGEQCPWHGLGPALCPVCGGTHP